MNANLLAEIRQSETPLIHGGAVTFVWEGKDPPKLVGDFNDWEWDAPVELHKTGRQTWSTTLDFPDDAYIEYIYFRRGERLLDPGNPRRTSNGLGKTNQYFYMPQAAPTPLIRRIEGIPVGQVTRHVIATEGLAVGKHRLVYLYQPPVRKHCPLLVVFDGREYLHRAHLNIIVDNLIAQRRIQPLALAFVFHGGAARLVEYTCSEATLGFINERLLPLAHQQLNLVDVEKHPGVYGVLGASLGGLMALFTGLRLPQFGKVLSQSGSFSYTEDSVVYELARSSRIAPQKIWLDVGRYESLLETNRRMQAQLLERGWPVVYREYNAGHNYPAWRNEIERGLIACYGIPTTRPDDRYAGVYEAFTQVGDRTDAMLPEDS